MIGRTLLHYEIVSELGAGAMGRVYLARDSRTGRRVAIKLLGQDREGGEARERLQREASAAARLSHPGIVTLYSLEDAAGELFLVQELVEGETLEDRLRRGPLGPAEVARLARELAAALAHAHAHGVLHRDLKPSNILIGADAHFKVADFGIARIEGAPTLTEAGTALGSLSYMAPERLSGARGDARSDLFGMGAIVYEAMSGKRAFAGAHEAAVTYAVMNEEPAPLDVPRSLEPLARLVLRLLAKEPAERPASAEVVAGLIAEMEVTRVTSAVPRRRARTGVMLALAGGLVLAAAAGAWWARSHVARDAEAGEPAVAVLPFENVANAGDPEKLGPITGNLLVTSLAQTPELNMLSTQRVLDAMRQIGRRLATSGPEGALEVARRAHATRLITGSILQTRPVIVMTAEVADVRSGKVVHAERVEGSPGQTVFQVVDLLSARLLQRMARAGETGRLGPLAQRTSTDLEAQRRYAEGVEHLAGGRLDRALASFQGAVERDPGFAQALYQLALTQWWWSEPAGARQTLERARALSERLSPLERDVIDGLDALAGYEWALAKRRFARLAQEHPHDKLIQYGLVEAAFHGHDYAVAYQAGIRTLTIDPNFTLAGVHVVDAMSSTGRLAEAESTAVGLIRRDPRNPMLRNSLFGTRLARADRAGAMSAASDARDAKAYDGLMPIGAMVLEFNAGDPRAARQWLPDPISPNERVDAGLFLDYMDALRRGRFRNALAVSRRAWALRDPTPSRGPGIPLADGWTAALGVRDTAAALFISDSAEARLRRWAGPFEAARARIGRINVLLDFGMLGRAESELLRMESLPEGQHEHTAGGMNFARAQILRAKGRHAEALEMLKDAEAPGPPFLRDAILILVGAQMRMESGQHGAALAAIDTLLSVPMFYPSDAVRLRFLRGRCLERLGRSAEAVASYREFLQLWKDADPGLPEVAETRAALARLRRPPQAAGGVPPPRPGRP